MNLSDLVFVDTETTGLDPARHDIWEVGLIHAYQAHGGKIEWIEHNWFLDLPGGLTFAEPAALNVNHFFERYPTKETTPSWEFATQFMKLTWGKHWVGAIPSFDEERLRSLLRKSGACPGWHYHLLDIESMCVGYLANKKIFFDLPYKYNDVARALNVPVDKYEKHTALGDARMVRDLFLKVMNL